MFVQLFVLFGAQIKATRFQTLIFSIQSFSWKAEISKLGSLNILLYNKINLKKVMLTITTLFKQDTASFGVRIFTI